MKVCAQWLETIVPDVPLPLDARSAIRTGGPLHDGRRRRRSHTGRIVGVPWRETTYRDTFKAGGPATPVTGHRHDRVRAAST